MKEIGIRNKVQTLSIRRKSQMVSCHEMKKGQILVCLDCGLEFEVVKECEECGEQEGSCGCEEHCEFQCCGEPMVLKT